MSILKDEKVIVQYISTTKNGITDKKHQLYGGLSNKAYIGIPAPRDIYNAFTKEELDELSQVLGEDLSIKSDFWKEYRMDEFGANNGIFPIALYKEGMFLNKKDPLDYIRIRTLEKSALIAKNHKDAKARSSEVRFVMLNQKTIHAEDIKNMDIKIEAMQHYMKYQDKEEVLTYLLRSFGKGVSADHSLDFLKKEAWKIMEFNTEAFNRTLSDKSLATKIELEDFVRYGLITKHNGFYFNSDGDKLSLAGESNDIDGASRYLDSGLGKEMKLELKAKVKALKK